VNRMRFTSEQILAKLLEVELELAASWLSLRDSPTMAHFSILRQSMLVFDKTYS